MVEFTCPGCLSRCVANEAFSGLRARCVVCGAFIRIPAESESVAPPLGPVPAGPLPDRHPKTAPGKPPKPSVRSRSESGLAVLPNPNVPAKRTRSAPEAYPVNDAFDTSGDGNDEATDERRHDQEALPLTGDTPARGAGKKAESELTNETAKTATKPKSKSKKKSAKLAGADLDGKLNWEDFDGEPQPETPPEEAPKSRKRQLIIVGGSVVAAVVIALVLGLSGGEKPKLPSTPPEVAYEPPPPPPKKEEKKEPPPPPPEIEVAPYPRPADNPNRFVAAQLLAERTINPTAFDTLYRGKLFVLRGTYARAVGSIMYLAEGAEDERGSIACVSPKVSKKDTGEPPPEASLLQSGQAVIVRGWYAGDLKFTDCRIVATSGPADDEYRDKIIELVGTIAKVNPVDADDAERFPSVVLEPVSTDCPVSVRCLFRITEREKLGILKPGQVITIRGRCEGRSFRVVRLHDCSLVPNADSPPPGVARVQADRFFAAYEVDLLHYERPHPTVPPLAINAEQLATAFSIDTRQANATYQYKTVAVTGKVLERRGGVVTLETGTNQKYQITARFTHRTFAAVKDVPVLTVTGTCVGLSGKFVRLENSNAADPDGGNFAIRLTPDYFPRQPGSDLVYDLLTPTGTRDSQIMRISAKFVDGDLLTSRPFAAEPSPRRLSLPTRLAYPSGWLPANNPKSRHGQPSTG